MYVYLPEAESEAFFLPAKTFNLSEAGTSSNPNNFANSGAFLLNILELTGIFCVLNSLIICI